MTHPGLEAPDRLAAGTSTGLDLAAVDWVGQMRRGYFGAGGTWER